MQQKKLTYKVGILGCPSVIEEWNVEQVNRIKQLGFNMLQLNIAWGGRPADEPLNLEDVVQIPPELAESLHQSIPLGSDQSEHAILRRRADLKQRIEWSKQAGLRTLFHFGAPYNGKAIYKGQGDTFENCLLDGVTQGRYVKLLNLFQVQFPGVDDLLLYTFDQDAGLCGEFGECPNCRGIPLHERVSVFVNALADAWQGCNPHGRLWWEPWELSAGQIYQAVKHLNPVKVGLMLHSNIAEVTAALPVDRFLKNACRQAEGLGLPVIVEGFLGGPSEEIEPFRHLAYPQVIIRQLRAIYQVHGIVGMKEYYGLVLSKEDIHLKATSVFFTNPDQTEEQIMNSIAAPYGENKESMIRFWSLTSEAIEMFPWDVSWWIRAVGKCTPKHTMNAAFIHGQQAHTPSWESTRRAIFMKTDDLEPDPWLLEDVQLRCETSADRIEEAIQLGKQIQMRAGKSIAASISESLTEMEKFKRIALSFAYHLRETNLASVMRKYQQEHKEIPVRLLREMEQILQLDRANQVDSEELDQAIALFHASVDQFLLTYFQIPETNRWMRNVTSR